MQRYGENAGSLSNTCVGGPGDIDAGVDSTTGIDAPPSSCPNDFAAITGGTTGHVYKLVAATDPWDTQRLACSGMGTAYLAIPDTAAELEAVVDLNGGDKLWVGITDQMTEGTFLNVKGVVQTFLPWKQGAPTTSPPNNQIDCVLADSATKILDSNRAAQEAAVCECDP